MLRLAIVVLVGCSGTIAGGGAGSAGPDAAPPAGLGAVARGAQWVDAMVPYCQAPNHQPDADTSCSATCDRPDVAAWDPYRSDCSGFVSWAWQLPPPGRTTAEFAPFKTDLTHAIAADELRAGDAVNNAQHMLLFVAWTKPGSEATFMEETGCSSKTPYAVMVTAPVTISGETITVEYRGTYTAIRYDGAP